jgi:hypothetical protein
MGWSSRILWRYLDEHGHEVPGCRKLGEVVFIEHADLCSAGPTHGAPCTKPSRQVGCS